MKTLFFLLTIAVLLTACKKNPTSPSPENELITTLKLTAIDSATGTPYIFEFKDIDGEGGASPTTDSVLFPGGSTFIASLLLLDERNTPVDTTNNEILELNTIHQFFYKSFPTDLITNFAYKDFDDNGKPLGLIFRFNTKSSATTGALRITLIHEVNKDGANVVHNDITNAGGSTDIEVNFPVRLY